MHPWLRQFFHFHFSWKSRKLEWPRSSVMDNTRSSNIESVLSTSNWFFSLTAGQSTKCWQHGIRCYCGFAQVCDEINRRTMLKLIRFSYLGTWLPASMLCRHIFFKSINKNNWLFCTGYLLYESRRRLSSSNLLRLFGYYADVDLSLII